MSVWMEKAFEMHRNCRQTPVSSEVLLVWQRERTGDMDVGVLS